MIYGVSGSNIGQIHIPNAKCSYCNLNGSHTISVYGKYGHIFWIPIFPIGKAVYCECDHCKKTISKSEFTPELLNEYNMSASTVKRPKWHSLGLIAIIGLLVFAQVSSLFDKKDPYEISLKADVANMTSAPDKTKDPLAYKLKSNFDVMANEEIEAQEFSYLTKVNADKVLVLIKIPNLKKVEKESRTQALELINSILDTDKSLKDKKRYIGLHGKFNFMVVNTPSENENKNLASDAPLLEFYK